MVWAICGRMPLIRQSAPIKTRGGHGLQQVLGHQGIHHRDAGDVDNGVIRPGLDDRFQQILHHHLRARAIQRSDERQRQDVLPKPHHGSGKLQQLFLLARDHFFARLLERFRRQQPEFVDKIAWPAKPRPPGPRRWS